jgi:hypothetical protein
MKAAKSKKLYLLASIIDESAVKTAPRTDENSVLFPIRYYEDKLRWDDKRVLQTQVRLCARLLIDWTVCSFSVYIATIIRGVVT